SAMAALREFGVQSRRARLVPAGLLLGAVVPAKRRVRRLAGTTVRREGLPQTRVDLREYRRARAQFALAERIEWRVDRLEMRVQVLRLPLDIEQAGDDLARRRALLQIRRGGEPVVRIVIGGELAQRELRAVVLLHDLDGAGG